MSNTGLKGITRVDSEAAGMNGFLVRVQWDGENRQSWIPDHEHPTREAALLHAIGERDGIEAELGKPRTDRHVRASGFIPWLGRKWRRA